MEEPGPVLLDPSMIKTEMDDETRSISPHQHVDEDTSSISPAQHVEEKPDVEDIAPDTLSSLPWRHDKRGPTTSTDSLLFVKLEEVEPGEQSGNSDEDDFATNLKSHVLDHSYALSGETGPVQNGGRPSTELCEMSRKSLHSVTVGAQTIKFPSCDICDEVFATPSQLGGHLSIHRGVKSFKCETCNKMFSGKKKLAEHRLTHVPTKKPFKCENCDETFSLSRNLRTHRRIHTGEKPYACQVCDKTFRWNSDLTDHHHIHAAGTVFECSVCLKKFGQFRKLIAHKNIHTCKVCSELISFWKNLDPSDPTSENTLECDICDEMFPQPSDLFRHRLVHLSGNMFRCELCPYTFPCRLQLIHHRNAHSGKRPIKCEMCMGFFTRFYTFNIHLGSHTCSEQPTV